MKPQNNFHPIVTKWSKEMKKKIRYPETINLNQPFHSPDVEPGLTEWDTCARAGLGLLATEDPVPGVPPVPPFMVYVGGGGRLEAVSILELKTSISAFCNKPELKIRAQISKCTYISKYYSLGTLFHCSYFYYNTWVDIRMS